MNTNFNLATTVGIAIVSIGVLIGCSKDEPATPGSAATTIRTKAGSGITGIFSGNPEGFTTHGGLGMLLTMCTSGTVCYTSTSNDPLYAVVRAGGIGFNKGIHANTYGEWYYIKANGQPAGTQWLKVHFKGAFDVAGAPKVATFNSTTHTWLIYTSPNWQASTTTPFSDIPVEHYCPEDCNVYLG